MVQCAGVLTGCPSFNAGRFLRSLDDMGVAMAVIMGTVSITGLPPHRGLIINLCFFKVADHSSLPPYNGDPPTEASTDCDKIFEHVDLDTESLETTVERQFGVERSPGYYYVQLRVILFRIWHGRVFAQAEQFFFARRPVHITTEPADNITFPLSWPTESLEELQHYGTVHPQSTRPWWKFW